MSRSDAASLSADLLVSKGEAGPSGSTSRLGDRLGLASIYGGASVRAMPPLRPMPLPGDPNARILLRVDEPRRRRLRLAAAQLGKTSQAILLDALDHYLSDVIPTLLKRPCPCITGPEQPAGSDCCAQRDTR